MNVRIKICGITRYEDAKTAVNLGVDALGFIFFEKSSRYVTVEQARAIIRKLPPFVSRVGVFVDQESSLINEIAAFTGIDTVQLHGSETPEYCSEINLPVIKAFSVRQDSDIAVLSTYKTAGYLLDTWRKDMFGGTGATFDWSIAKRACSTHDNVIIAGGLGPSNIIEALQAAHPYGVDLNSGVEIRPGEKNPHKMRDVINLIRKWKPS